MHFRDLDETVRTEMPREIRFDLQQGVLYQSPRLSANGQADWPYLLTQAAESGTPESLAAELRRNARLVGTEMSVRNGIPYSKAVPHNAADTLAEGEFNRFYIRSVCTIALDRGQTHVAIYRAKNVTKPRAESVSLVGSSIDARVLREDLRTHPGVDTALGVPAGPNSGLSVHLLSSSASGVEPPDLSTDLIQAGEPSTDYQSSGQQA